MLTTAALVMMTTTREAFASLVHVLPIVGAAAAAVAALLTILPYLRKQSRNPRLHFLLRLIACDYRADAALAASLLLIICISTTQLGDIALA